MQQPATDWITCDACNASYESEAKLREHQQMSHRGGGSLERPKIEAGAEESESPEA